MLIAESKASAEGPAANSGAAFEAYIQNGRNKRLYKYSSMNENHRRTSLASPIQSRINSASKQQRKQLVAQQQQQQQQQLQLQQAEQQAVPLKNYYSKHTNSMKEIKSNLMSSANMRRASCLGNDDANIRAKLLTNNAVNSHQMRLQQQQQQYKMNDTSSVNSMQFVRPLKTSTAVCLTDLTRKRTPSQQQEQMLLQNPELANLQKVAQPQHSSDTSSNASSSLSSESSTTIQIPKKFKTLNGIY